MKRQTLSRVLRLLTAVVLLLSVSASAGAEVFVNGEKPADWQERNLMTIIVAETVYNDAIFIQQGEYRMLVDGGTKKYRKRIVKFIQENGFETPDILFNTHPHDDHLECADRMMEEGEIKPKLFMTAFPETYRNPLQQRTMKALAEKEIPWVRVNNEEEFTLGDMHFTVYQWPEGNDPNELSAVLHLLFGGATILLTGDITGGGQKWLAASHADDIRSDILKVPHHGLVVMVGAFVDAVDPDFVFVTSRTKATEKVNAQLKSRKIPYMHHSVGTIIMETDGTDWYITQTAGLI